MVLVAPRVASPGTGVADTVLSRTGVSPLNFKFLC